MMPRLCCFVFFALTSQIGLAQDGPSGEIWSRPPLPRVELPPGCESLSEFKSLVNLGILKLSEERRKILLASLENLSREIKRKQLAYQQAANAIDTNVENFDLEKAEQLEIQALVESAAEEIRGFFTTEEEWEDARAANLRMVLELGSDGFNLDGVLSRDWLRMRAGISEGQVVALRAMMRSDELRKARLELINTNPAKNRGGVLRVNMDGYPEYRKKLIRMQLSILSEEEAANLDEILQLDDDHELSLRKNWRILIKRK